MKRTWESMRKHEKTLEKCQISLASELDLDPPELPAIGSGSVSRITSRPQTRQTWSLRLSVDTGSGLLSDFTLLHLA
jgi:hypothetical protein